MLALAVAAVASVPCSFHAEPSPPKPTAARWVLAGPVAFAAKHQGVSEQRNGHVGKKAGISVDAGNPVTLKVLTKGAGVHYRRVRNPSLANTDRIVRITPCAPDTPMFSDKNGTVGERTGFAGGVMADRRKCVRIRVSRDGQSWIARIPVGAACR